MKIGAFDCYEFFHSIDTLISLINVKSRLPVLKNFTLHKKNPPSTFIDFLDFLHSPRLFQPPRLLER